MGGILGLTFGCWFRCPAIAISPLLRRGAIIIAMIDVRIIKSTRTSILSGVNYLNLIVCPRPSLGSLLSRDKNRVGLARREKVKTESGSERPAGAGPTLHKLLEGGKT